MRLPARFGAAASLLAIAFAAACGSDSTGPGDSNSPSRIARHFDSLYVEASTQDGYQVRQQLLSLLEVNAAFGAAPAPITVTTASGTEHWKGYEFLEINPNVDSTYVLLAYRDADASTVAVVYFQGDGEISEAAFITNDTLQVLPSGGDGATHISTTGATCGSISSALVNPVLGSVSISSCNLATFATSLTLQMPSTVGMDAALTSITFPTTTINGILVVDTETARRVHDLLRMSHTANKL